LRHEHILTTAKKKVKKKNTRHIEDANDRKRLQCFYHGNFFIDTWIDKIVHTFTNPNKYTHITTYYFQQSMVSHHQESFTTIRELNHILPPLIKSTKWVFAANANNAYWVLIVLNMQSHTIQQIDFDPPTHELSLTLRSFLEKEYHLSFSDKLYSLVTRQEPGSNDCGVWVIK